MYLRLVPVCAEPIIETDQNQQLNDSSPPIPRIKPNSSCRSLFGDEENLPESPKRHSKTSGGQSKAITLKNSPPHQRIVSTKCSATFADFQSPQTCIRGILNLHCDKFTPTKENFQRIFVKTEKDQTNTHCWYIEDKCTSKLKRKKKGAKTIPNTPLIGGHVSVFPTTPTHRFTQNGKLSNSSSLIYVIFLVRYLIATLYHQPLNLKCPNFQKWSSRGHILKSLQGYLDIPESLARKLANPRREDSTIV